MKEPMIKIKCVMCGEYKDPDEFFIGKDDKYGYKGFCDECIGDCET
jgi:hypothetical protein